MTREEVNIQLDAYSENIGKRTDNDHRSRWDFDDILIPLVMFLIGLILLVTGCSRPAQADLVAPSPVTVQSDISATDSYVKKAQDELASVHPKTAEGNAKLSELRLDLSAAQTSEQATETAFQQYQKASNQQLSDLTKQDQAQANQIVSLKATVSRESLDGWIIFGFEALLVALGLFSLAKLVIPWLAVAYPPLAPIALILKAL